MTGGEAARDQGRRVKRDQHLGAEEMGYREVRGSHAAEAQPQSGVTQTNRREQQESEGAEGTVFSVRCAGVLL